MRETLKMIQGRTIAKTWNECHPIGAEVILIDDDGEREDTTTGSQAWTLGDGAPVILVECRSGSYALERIIAKPIARSTMSQQTAIDINAAARCMTFQEAAKLCAEYEDVPGGPNASVGPMTLAARFLDMAHDAEPDGRDLELDWDQELAELVAKWRTD